MGKFDKQVERNLEGIALEKEGRIDEAVILYEQNVEENFIGNGPYDRLAIIFHKQKRFNDEIRVLEKAVWVFEKKVSKARGDREPKLERFRKRLEKAKLNVAGDVVGEKKNVDSPKLLERRKFIEKLKLLEISIDEYDREKSKLSKKFGIVEEKVLEHDILWSILNTQILHTNDPYKLMHIYRRLEEILEKEGKFNFRIRQESIRMYLRSIQEEKDPVRRRMNKGVKITVRHNSCPSCTKLDGKILSINKALKKMSIPNKECTFEYRGKKGYCRCKYLEIIR